MMGVAALLTLIACNPPLTGGTIVGKSTKIKSGMVNDTVQYFIQIKKGERHATVEVTKAAWDQAKTQMVWPFEVKK